MVRYSKVCIVQGLGKGLLIMKDKNVVLVDREPQPVDAVFVPEKSYAIARHVVGTILGILVFAAAVLLSDASHLKMPGHIVH